MGWWDGQGYGTLVLSPFQGAGEVCVSNRLRQYGTRHTPLVAPGMSGYWNEERTLTAAPGGLWREAPKNIMYKEARIEDTEARKYREAMKCRDPQHSHSTVLALQPIECLGAELGLLAPVGHAKAQALADELCKRADAPLVSVEIAFAPKKRYEKLQGWHCTGIRTDSALFQYPNVIVLNSYTLYGSTLITLAHELAHHMAPTAAPPGGHGPPFAETFRTMVENIAGGS